MFVSVMIPTFSDPAELQLKGLVLHLVMHNINTEIHKTLSKSVPQWNTPPYSGLTFLPLLSRDLWWTYPSSGNVTKLYLSWENKYNTRNICLYFFDFCLGILFRFARCTTIVTLKQTITYYLAVFSWKQAYEVYKSYKWNTRRIDDVQLGTIIVKTAHHNGRAKWSYRAVQRVGVHVHRHSVAQVLGRYT